MESIYPIPRVITWIFFFYSLILFIISSLDDLLSSVVVLFCYYGGREGEISRALFIYTYILRVETPNTH